MDYIRFSFNYSSLKNVSACVYNFDTNNLTIKLHYYTEVRILYTDKTKEEVRNLTYNQYISDKSKFEPDVSYIISIFNSEFESEPRSVDYIQNIRHSILM